MSILNVLTNTPNLGRAQIDCDTSAETFGFYVGKNTVVSVAAQTQGETAWSTGVLTLKWRLCKDDDWQNFPTSLTITQTTPYQFQVDAFGFPWLGVAVSTTQSGVRLMVTVWAEGET